MADQETETDTDEQRRQRIAAHDGAQVFDHAPDAFLFEVMAAAFERLLARPAAAVPIDALLGDILAAAYPPGSACPEPSAALPALRPDRGPFCAKWRAMSAAEEAASRTLLSIACQLSLLQRALVWIRLVLPASSGV